MVLALAAIGVFVFPSGGWGHSTKTPVAVSAEGSYLPPPDAPAGCESPYALPQNQFWEFPADTEAAIKPTQMIGPDLDLPCSVHSAEIRGQVSSSARRCLADREVILRTIDHRPLARESALTDHTGYFESDAWRESAREAEWRAEVERLVYRSSPEHRHVCRSAKSEKFTFEPTS